MAEQQIISARSSETHEESSDSSDSSASEDIYEVQKIMGMVKTKGKTLYKVRWVGYGPDYDTWEPVENLNSCTDIIKEYLKKYEKQEKKKEKSKKKHQEIPMEELSNDGVGSGSASPGASSTTSTTSSTTPGAQTSSTSVTSPTDHQREKKPTWKYVTNDQEEFDTLKDKFWRDLEQGRINVFEQGDMYTKVKGPGRASRPQSFTQMFENKIPTREEDKESRPQTATRGHRRGGSTRGKGRRSEDDNSRESCGKRGLDEGGGARREGTAKRGRGGKGRGGNRGASHSTCTVTSPSYSDNSMGASFTSQASNSPTQTSGGNQQSNVATPQTSDTPAQSTPSSDHFESTGSQLLSEFSSVSIGSQPEGPSNFHVISSNAPMAPDLSGESSRASGISTGAPVDSIISLPGGQRESLSRQMSVDSNSDGSVEVDRLSSMDTEFLEVQEDRGKTDTVFDEGDCYSSNHVSTTYTTNTTAFLITAHLRAANMPTTQSSVAITTTNSGVVAWAPSGHNLVTTSSFGQSVVATVTNPVRDSVSMVTPACCVNLLPPGGDRRRFECRVVLERLPETMLTGYRTHSETHSKNPLGVVSDFTRNTQGVRTKNSNKQINATVRASRSLRSRTKQGSEIKCMVTRESKHGGRDKADCQSTRHKNITQNTSQGNRIQSKELVGLSNYLASDSQQTGLCSKHLTSSLTQGSEYSQRLRRLKRKCIVANCDDSPDVTTKDASSANSSHPVPKTTETCPRKHSGEQTLSKPNRASTTFPNTCTITSDSVSSHSRLNPKEISANSAYNVFATPIVPLKRLRLARDTRSTAQLLKTSNSKSNISQPETHTKQTRLKHRQLIHTSSSSQHLSFEQVPVNRDHSDSPSRFITPNPVHSIYSASNARRVKQNPSVRLNAQSEECQHLDDIDSRNPESESEPYKRANTRSSNLTSTNSADLQSQNALLKQLLISLTPLRVDQFDNYSIDFGAMRSEMSKRFQRYCPKPNLKTKSIPQSESRETLQKLTRLKHQQLNHASSSEQHLSFEHDHSKAPSSDSSSEFITPNPVDSAINHSQFNARRVEQNPSVTLDTDSEECQRLDDIDSCNPETESEPGIKLENSNESASFTSTNSADPRSQNAFLKQLLISLTPLRLDRFDNYPSPRHFGIMPSEIPKLPFSRYRPPKVQLSGYHSEPNSPEKVKLESDHSASTERCQSPIVCSDQELSSSPVVSSNNSKVPSHQMSFPPLKTVKRLFPVTFKTPFPHPLQSETPTDNLIDSDSQDIPENVIMISPISSPELSTSDIMDSMICKVPEQTPIPKSELLNLSPPNHHIPVSVKVPSPDRMGVSNLSQETESETVVSSESKFSQLKSSHSKSTETNCSSVISKSPQNLESNHHGSSSVSIQPIVMGNPKHSISMNHVPATPLHFPNETTFLTPVSPDDDANPMINESILLELQTHQPQPKDLTDFTPDSLTAGEATPEPEDKTNRTSKAPIKQDTHKLPVYSALCSPVRLYAEAETPSYDPTLAEEQSLPLRYSGFQSPVHLEPEEPIRDRAISAAARFRSVMVPMTPVREPTPPNPFMTPVPEPNLPSSFLTPVPEPNLPDPFSDGIFDVPYLTPRPIGISAVRIEFSKQHRRTRSSGVPRSEPTRQTHPDFAIPSNPKHKRKTRPSRIPRGFAIPSSTRKHKPKARPRVKQKQKCSTSDDSLASDSLASEAELPTITSLQSPCTETSDVMFAHPYDFLNLSGIFQEMQPLTMTASSELYEPITPTHSLNGDLLNLETTDDLVEFLSSCGLNICQSVIGRDLSPLPNSMNSPSSMTPTGSSDGGLNAEMFSLQNDAAQLVLDTGVSRHSVTATGQAQTPIDSTDLSQWISHAYASPDHVTLFDLNTMEILSDSVSNENFKSPAPEPCISPSSNILNLQSEPHESSQLSHCLSQSSGSDQNAPMSLNEQLDSCLLQSFYEPLTPETPSNDANNSPQSQTLPAQQIIWEIESDLQINPNTHVSTEVSLNQPHQSLCPVQDSLPSNVDPTVYKAMREPPLSDKPISTHLDSHEPISEHSKSHEPISEHSGSHEPIREPSLSDKPISTHPDSHEPISEHSKSHEPISEHSKSHEPISEHSGSHEPIREPPLSDKPISTHLDSHEPISEHSKSHEPISEHSGSHEPIREPPLSDKPISTHLDSHEPISEHSKSHEPISEHSGSHEPISTHSDFYEPISPYSDSHEPISEHSKSHEPISEHSKSHEPISEHSGSHEPIREPPLSDKPISTHLDSHEPISEHSKSHEPISEHSGSHEPIREPPLSDKPISTHLDSHEPISEHSKSHEPISEHSGSYEPIREPPLFDKPISTHPDSHEPISEHTGSQEPISIHSDFYEPISPHSDSNEPISEHSKSHEPISEHSGSHEPIREPPVFDKPISTHPDSHETISEHTGSHEPIREPSLYDKPISTHSDSHEPISEHSEYHKPICNPVVSPKTSNKSCSFQEAFSRKVLEDLSYRDSLDKTCSSLDHSNDNSHKTISKSPVFHATTTPRITEKHELSDRQKQDTILPSEHSKLDKPLLSPSYKYVHTSPNFQNMPTFGSPVTCEMDRDLVSNMPPSNDSGVECRLIDDVHCALSACSTPASTSSIPAIETSTVMSNESGVFTDSLDTHHSPEPSPMDIEPSSNSDNTSHKRKLEVSETDSSKKICEHLDPETGLICEVSESGLLSSFTNSNITTTSGSIGGETKPVVSSPNVSIIPSDPTPSSQGSTSSNHSKTSDSMQSNTVSKDSSLQATVRLKTSPESKPLTKDVPGSDGAEEAGLSGSTQVPVSEGTATNDAENQQITNVQQKLPLNNNKGETGDEEYEFDLEELDPIEYGGKKITPKPAMPDVLDLSNAELRHVVCGNDYECLTRALKSRTVYDLEQPDHQGVTLVMSAALNGFDDVLELLVLKGANINAEMKNGTSAIMLACEQGLLCTVALLLAMGADMNHHNNTGETPLIKAVRRGHKHVVKLLLDNGANFASPYNMDTPLKWAKNQRDMLELLNNHISRLKSEYEHQVQITLNNTAHIQCALFPMQCFALRESDKFKVFFKHELQPTKPGVGMLLFIAHARISSSEVRCRFYGPCAVTNVILNGSKLTPLTEEGNFVMSFCPLHNGRNDLEINTVRAPTSKAKLIVCAYKAQLM